MGLLAGEKLLLIFELRINRKTRLFRIFMHLEKINFKILKANVQK
jgi:hypothetical protein